MGKVYPILPTVAKNARINQEERQRLYQFSIDHPDIFWAEQAKQYITWMEPWQKVCSGDFTHSNVRWFQGAKLNASYNCLDRHLPHRAQDIAIIWEGDDPSQSEHITYQDLYERVCRFANVLKARGVKKGSRVCIYLPMIPEAAVAMLACTRIGAIHSVVFGGFSAEALKSRIIDAGCEVVITANESLRGGKTTPLKKQVDQALEEVALVNTVIVVKRTEGDTPWKDERDYWYHELMSTASSACPVEEMDAEDPLFILYTSGSTGKPKGILHGTGGYLLYAAMTHALIFDYRPHEIYWCTADVGWITGHTYVVYGPLLNGATTLLFEGVPNFPSASRCWEIVDKHQVNIFYTAPTALRALRREGDQWVQSTSRQSLRILGSVGEPINPDAWEWYYQVVGESRCPIVDTWWQTETGGIMISALPGATSLKPGSATLPFFGIVPKIVDDQGQEVPAGTMGKLLISYAWPGMMQTVYGDHERFINTYFKEFPGFYMPGDQAYKDEEGYYWITGRSDDVLKVSGHRIGTEEIESALVHHPLVAEAAVVGVADEIKGHNIYAFVTLKLGVEPTENLKAELIETVRIGVGPIAIPGFIQFAEALPKTRSGKIMRRILRKIAEGETEDLGDLTTLADPTVVAILIKG